VPDLWVEEVTAERLRLCVGVVELFASVATD